MFWRTWIQKQFNIRSYPSWAQNLQVSAMLRCLVGFGGWTACSVIQSWVGKTASSLQLWGWWWEEGECCIHVESPTRQFTTTGTDEAKTTNPVVKHRVVTKPGFYWTELKHSILAQRKASEPFGRCGRMFYFFVAVLFFCPMVPWWYQRLHKAN